MIIAALVRNGAITRTAADISVTKCFPMTEIPLLRVKEMGQVAKQVGSIPPHLRVYCVDVSLRENFDKFLNGRQIASTEAADLDAAMAFFKSYLIKNYKEIVSNLEDM